MYIQRLFLRFTIYDCSDPVGNLRTKTVVLCMSEIGQFCETVVHRNIYDLRSIVKRGPGRDIFRYIFNKRLGP